MGQHAIAPGPDHNRGRTDGDCLRIDLFEYKESRKIGVRYQQKLFFLMNFLQDTWQKIMLNPPKTNPKYNPN